MKYQVINDVRLSLEVEAEDPDHAVRKARDTSLDVWSIGDQDEIEVYEDETGEYVEFDWSRVEELWGHTEEPDGEARVSTDLTNA